MQHAEAFQFWPQLSLFILEAANHFYLRENSNFIIQSPCSCQANAFFNLPYQKYILILTVLVRVSTAVRDTMVTATLIKETILWGLAYSFRGSIHYHHGGTWWHAGRHGAGELER